MSKQLEEYQTYRSECRARKLPYLTYSEWLRNGEPTYQQISREVRARKYAKDYLYV